MGHSKKKLLLSVGFTLLFLGLGILIFSPLLIAKASTPNRNISAHYTGNDGWLTPANARGFLKVDGKIHWVYTKEHDGKRRVAYSYSEDGGRTFGQGVLIAPFVRGLNQYQADPCIVAQSDGTLHIFYHEGYPDYGYVYWIHSEDGGKSWSSPYKVSMYRRYPSDPDPGNDSFSPSACVDSNNNIHLIMCQGHRVGITYYYYDRLTKTWTNGYQVFNGWDSGDCRYPSITVDSNNDLHLFYGIGVWFSRDSASYLYQKREGGVWQPYEYFGVYRPTNEPIILVDQNNIPIVSWPGGQIYYGVSVGAGVLLRNNPKASLPKDRWTWHPILNPITSGGQLTIGSVQELIFPNRIGENVSRSCSYDQGITWITTQITSDYNPQTGYNKNTNPRTAWSKYNFPRELATAFFFEKQTPANPKGSPYQLWFVGGEGSPPSVITELSAEPTQFDPYTKDGETTISYVLSRDSSVSIEILDSSGKVVKKKLPRVGNAPGEKGSNTVVWNGVIDLPELTKGTVNSDDLSVFLAPDGIYTTRVTAKDKVNPSIADTKEIKVKVKTSW